MKLMKLVLQGHTYENLTRLLPKIRAPLKALELKWKASLPNFHDKTFSGSPIRRRIEWAIMKFRREIKDKCLRIMKRTPSANTDALVLGLSQLLLGFLRHSRLLSASLLDILSLLASIALSTSSSFHRLLNPIRSILLPVIRAIHFDGVCRHLSCDDLKTLEFHAFELLNSRA